MPHSAPFDLHVCTGCKGGAALLAALTAGCADMTGARCHGFTCLGGCTSRGRVSVAASGRWGWLFGGIDGDADLADLRAFILAWRAAPDGLVAKKDRPEPLRKRILGRMPPMDGAI